MCVLFYIEHFIFSDLFCILLYFSVVRLYYFSAFSRIFDCFGGFSSDVVFWLENNVFLLTKTIDIGAPQIEYSLWQVEAGCRLLKKNDTHLNCGFSIGHQKGSMFVDWMGNKWLTWRLRPNMRSNHHTHIHVYNSEQAHFWFGSSTFTKDLLVFHRETLCILFAMHFFSTIVKVFCDKNWNEVEIHTKIRVNVLPKYMHKDEIDAYFKNAKGFTSKMQKVSFVILEISFKNEKYTQRTNKRRK